MPSDYRPFWRCGRRWSAGSQESNKLWKLSQKYYSEGKSIESDFYLTLHLNTELSEPERQIPDLFKKLDQRKIPPLYFIDGRYSAEFFGQFFGGSLFQWRASGTDDRNFVIATQIGEDKYKYLYALVWGQPELTQWKIINGDNIRHSYLLGYRSAYINVGHYDKDDMPIPCDAFEIKGMLTSVYTPKFFDLDGDGLPELLLRYNLAVADGYVQTLKIYTSSNKTDLCKRKLIKEFSARNGFILQSGQHFKIGTQERGNETEGWLGASTHKVKEIDFDGKM